VSEERRSGHSRLFVRDGKIVKEGIVSEASERALREHVAYQIKCAAYNQPLMGVDWSRSENQRWLDVADQIIEQAVRAKREACAKMIERKNIALAKERAAHPPTTEQEARAIAVCNRVLGANWRQQSAIVVAAAIEQAVRDGVEFALTRLSDEAAYLGIADEKVDAIIAAIRQRTGGKRA
jgi:hypothetical protein